MTWGGVDVTIIEIKCTINVVWLNHPETNPLLLVQEKIVSMKMIPGAKKIETADLGHSALLTITFL